MFHRMLAAAFVLGVAAVAAPAHAEGPQCGARADVIEMLREKHGEAVTGAGLAGDSAVVELWASPVTGTWTILMTRPDGATCLMAAGEAWTGANPKLAALGDPA